MAHTMVTIMRESVPILYFDSDITPGTTANKIQLTAGSIWIPSQQFVSTAPPLHFLALKVKSAQILFSSNVSTSARPIVIGTNIVVTVSIQLEGTLTAPKNVSFQAPGSATFILKSTVAVLQSAGNASIGVFGATLAMGFSNPTATYDASLEKIGFSGYLSNSALTVTGGHTELLDFSGISIGIDHYAWLPDAQLGIPTIVTEATGPGSLAIYLMTGLQIIMADAILNSGNMECGACSILVNADELSVSGSNLKPTTSKRTVFLSQKNSIILSVQNGGSFFKYTSNSNGNETWAEYATMVASLDQPRNVRNERATLKGIGAFELLKTCNSGTDPSPVQVEIDLSIDMRLPPASGSQFQSYALKNLFLKAESPKGLVAQGVLQDGKVQSGNYRLISNLRYVLPFLPDPYVTNLDINWGDAIDNVIIGDLEMTISWNSDNATTFDVSLPSGSLSHVLRLPSNPPAPDPKDPNTSYLERLESQLSSLQGEVELYGPTMLDISTNSSQFGVFIQTMEYAEVQPAPLVSQLYMQSPANRLRIVTLPQVEWEPVSTPDQTVPFPSPFIFPDSGPPAQLGTNSVTLIPVSPHDAVGGLVNCYTTEAKSKIGALFTAPFGIVSYAGLAKTPSTHFISPSFKLIQPAFSSISFKGGDQLSLRAGFPLLQSLSGSTPSLLGESMIMQYQNTSAAGTYTSILGPQATYNNDFRNGPIIPINRVDISGFGASMFTDWRDETVTPPATSQVDLEVIVGRTEREVVVQIMELVYCGAKATRTVVMQRLNNGQVRRQVFLKPTGDGTFTFIDTTITTHTGLVQRVVNIRNMREVNDASYAVGNIQFWPVQYDCDIQIRATSTSTPILVPALNHRGYLASLSPSAPPDTHLQLQNYDGLIKLLPNKNLTLGGPIDCIIKFSNLTVKLTGIGVDMATNSVSGQRETVIAAFGLPEFAGHGEWSVVQKQAGPVAPTHLDNASVPIIRENQSFTNVAGSTPNPLRFADPGDLFASVPSVDYCILHTADTVRTLFPRPKIEDDGLNQISSVLSPLIADPYAMANCSGVFPLLSSCIPLENLDPSQVANFKLPIDPDGFLSLFNPNADPVTGTFPSPIPTLNRVLRGDDLPTLAAVNQDDITLLINSASPDAAKAFSFAAKAVKLASFDGQKTINQGLNELVNIAGDMLNTPDLKPLLQQTAMTLGQFMDSVKDVIAFLSKLGPLPPLKVQMDADFTIHVSLTFNLGTYLDHLKEVAPPLVAFIEEFVDQFDFNVDHTQQLLTHNTKFGIKPVFKIPTPFPPAIAVASATFDAAFSNGLPTLNFGLGAGIGVDFGVGPFSAKGYVLVTQSIGEAAGSFSVGTDILVKASVNVLDLIKADVVIETKVELLAVHCSKDPVDAAPVIWGIAQFTLGIDVSIFLVIDISFHTSGEWRNKFNDGNCQPEDFGH